jgi:hypothetical protein
VSKWYRTNRYAKTVPNAVTLAPTENRATVNGPSPRWAEADAATSAPATGKRMDSHKRPRSVGRPRLRRCTVHLPPQAGSRTTLAAQGATNPLSPECDLESLEEIVAILGDRRLMESIERSRQDAAADKRVDLPGKAKGHR